MERRGGREGKQRQEKQSRHRCGSPQRATAGAKHCPYSAHRYRLSAKSPMMSTHTSSEALSFPADWLPVLETAEPQLCPSPPRDPGLSTLSQNETRLRRAAVSHVTLGRWAWQPQEQGEQGGANIMPKAHGARRLVWRRVAAEQRRSAGWPERRATHDSRRGLAPARGRRRVRRVSATAQAGSPLVVCSFAGQRASLSQAHRCTLPRQPMPLRRDPPGWLCWLPPHGLA